MKYLLLIGCFFFVTHANNAASEMYYVDNFNGKDTIIFCVKDLRAVNKNSDKAISNYIKRYSQNQSLSANTHQYKSAKKGAYLLFFWKNVSKNEYGFVIADRIKADEWKARLNGQDYWSRIQSGEEEIFKWFTQGRSIGVTLMNDKSYSIKYIFSGDVDF